MDRGAAYASGIRDCASAADPGVSGSDGGGDARETQTVPQFWKVLGFTEKENGAELYVSETQR
jgi:hypothetical protein